MSQQNRSPEGEFIDAPPDWRFFIPSMVVVVDVSIFVAVVADGWLSLLSGWLRGSIGAEVVVVVYNVAAAVVVVVVLKVVAAEEVVVDGIVVVALVVFEVITSLMGEQSVVWKKY